MGKTFTVTVKGQDQEFESKFDVLDEAIEALVAKNRGKFALDLVASHHSARGLSDAQVAWVHKLASEEGTRSEPLELGLMGLLAALHGLPSGKRAKIKVTDDLEISLNGEKSKNPGHISVTDGGPYKENTYYGRIDDNGTVYPAKAWTAEVLRCLEDFNTKNGGGESDDLPF